MPVHQSSVVPVPATARAGVEHARVGGASGVLAGAPAWVVLATIVAGSFVARFAAALAHPSPQYVQDEYLYPALARSIAHGRLTSRGGPTGFLAVFEPLLAAPAWLPDDPALAYRLTQGLHALAISLAAVPVFLLARRLAVPARDALLAAAATVVLPSFAFAAYVTADAVGVTIALFAVLAGVAALERPTARAQALFLLAALAATMTRLQYVFLPAAFLVAALVVERGGLRARLRAFRVTVLTLVAAAATIVLVGAGRVAGIYDGLFQFHVSLLGLGHWLAIGTFLVGIATGVVVLPGALVGLAASLGGRAGRAERGFAALALVALLALLLEAALFATNLQPRFIERYLMLAGPLLLVGLCLVTRRSGGRTRAIAASVVLALAVMRIPLSGYAADRGKRDSPLLWAEFWLEGKLGVGEAGLLVAAVAGLLLACSVLAFRLWERAVAFCLVVAVAVGAATSVAAAAYDAHRSTLARTTFLPVDVRWVDHARLGPVTMLVTPGTDPPVASTHLFWNTSLESVALLDGAVRVDAFRAGRARIGPDGSVSVDGRPLRGPVLVEEYANAVQLEGAGLVSRTHGTALWRTDSAVRVALQAEGRYLDGWLVFGARLRTWPSGGAGRGAVVFTLSLPPDVPAQRVELKGAGGDRVVVVPSGGTRRVVLPIDRSRRTAVTVRCATALQVGGNRLACAKASVPRLVTTDTAERSG